MKKQELINLLKKLKIQVNEGITSNLATNVYPRVVFWDYVWEDQMSSGCDYNTIVTYQISFYSKQPRDSKLIELKKLFNKEGIHPFITHEYVEKDKVFHSFMSIEVTEDELFEDV